MRALLLVPLAFGGACYDFTLPDPGPATSSTSASTTTGQGGQGGSGGAGAGGASSFPPPCDQYDCNGCVACASNLIIGDPASCETYTACVDACAGDQLCEAGCTGQHPLGLSYFEALRNRCMSSCSGDPPCQ